jgi:hypothetical protein
LRKESRIDSVISNSGTPKQSTSLKEKKSSQSLLRKPAGNSSVEGKGKPGTGNIATPADPKKTLV